MAILAMPLQEVVNNKLNGVSRIHDIYTGIQYNARISASLGYHHSDFMPCTEEDARLMRSILSKWSWNQNGGSSSGVRPATMKWEQGGKTFITAGSFHLMPHDVNIYGNLAYYIGNNKTMREGGQANWGHFCWHYIDSLSRRASGWSDWNQKMNDAIYEAIKLLGGTNIVKVPNIPEVAHKPIEVAINEIYTVQHVSTHLNCRANPSTSATIVGTFANGTRLYGSKKYDDWAYVSNENGSIKGWSSLAYLGSCKEEEILSCDYGVTVNGTNLHIRNGPGTQFDIMGKVNTPDKLRIVEEVVGGSYLWGRISGGDHNGRWVALNFTIRDNYMPNGKSIYTVKAGDTLSAIARDFNVSLWDIEAINNIEDIHSIKIGQELKIPA